MAGARYYNPPPPLFSSPSPFNHQIHPTESAETKRYNSEWKWMTSSPEAKQRSAAAKAQAFAAFQKRFPRADKSKFIAQVDFDANRKATATVLFPDGNGSWEDPLLEDQTYWSQPLKDQHNIRRLYQSRRLNSLTAQGKASLIYSTKRSRST